MVLRCHKADILMRYRLALRSATFMCQHDGPHCGGFPAMACLESAPQSRHELRVLA